MEFVKTPIGGIFLVGDDGSSVARYFEKEEEAWRLRAATERRLTDGSNLVVTKALDKYETYMKEEKGNKPDSEEQTSRKLRQFFPNDLLLSSLTAAPGASVVRRVQGTKEEERGADRRGPSSQRSGGGQDVRELVCEEEVFEVEPAGKR
ncbi:MAG: hypothetical protein JWM58_4654 [Rhizobium sp.]|nr:hypothetical protein [Rhizobium sp.]